MGKANSIYSIPITLPDFSSISSSESKDVITNYLSDESKIITGDPANVQKVFFPESTEEVASILKKASKQKIQVTTSGAGTGLTGSRVAYKGWILSTEKLRSVSKRDTEQVKTWTESETNIKYTVSVIEKEHTAPHIRVPVSMRLRTVQHLVKSLGYFYPPDTTEWSSFIGGNVATNASGARTFKYGPTRNYVDAMRVVLSTGTVLDLHRGQTTDDSFAWEIIDSQTNETLKVHVNKSFPSPNVSKNAVGFPIYDTMPLIELFIGTEGMFGVVTEVVLRLLTFPKNIFSLISYFETQDQAIKFVQQAQKQKFDQIEPVPMSVEFFDYKALQLVKKTHAHAQIPVKALAAVYLEQDVEDESKIDQFLEFWLEQLESVGYIDSWAETDDRGIEKHKEFRHSLPLGVHEVIKKNNVSKVGTDFAVPQSAFGSFLTMLIETGKQYEEYQNSRKQLADGITGYVIYGHIGDNHLHMNFLPRNQEELHKAEAMYLDMAKEVVKLGGTLSAEHGVGKKHYGGKPYIWYMIGDEGIGEYKKVKAMLDPANILNIGNVIG